MVTQQPLPQGRSQDYSSQHALGTNMATLQPLPRVYSSQHALGTNMATSSPKQDRGMGAGQGQGVGNAGQGQGAARNIVTRNRTESKGGQEEGQGIRQIQAGRGSRAEGKGWEETRRAEGGEAGTERSKHGREANDLQNGRDCEPAAQCPFTQKV